MSTVQTLMIYSGGTYYPGGEDGTNVVGDTGYLSGSDVGGNDSFSGASNVAYYSALGDSYEMTGSSRGGNDYFIGGDNVSDAYSGGGSGIVTGLSDAGALGFLGLSGGVNYGGDAYFMGDRATGGSDTMVGGTNSVNMFAGDALYVATGMARGGNDYLYAGDAVNGNSTNLLFGDAGMFGGEEIGPRSAVSKGGSDNSRVAGGSDYLSGGDAIAASTPTVNTNLLVGDAYAIYGRSTGGADEIYGGEAYAYSDTTDIDAGALNFIAGDGYEIGGGAKGGADELYGGTAYSSGGDAYAINVMMGDGFGIDAGGAAGSDFLSGGNAWGPEVSSATGMGAGTINLMVGDSIFTEGAAKLGSDVLHGGSSNLGSDGYVLNAIYGDTGTFSGGPPPLMNEDLSALGASSLAATASLSDFFTLADPATRSPTFGNDTLIGGDGQAENYLVGDASFLMPKAKGGSDVLYAGGEGSINYLIGDSEHMAPGSRGGNDRLVSGTGNDTMFGDSPDGYLARGGSDTFVFAPGNGTDTVEDFRPRDRDKIDLSAFDDSDFASFRAFMSSGRAEETEDGVVLYLSVVPPSDFEAAGRGDTVLLVGVTMDQLTANSFIF